MNWDWRNHREKAEVASKLFEKKVVSVDVGETLAHLNRLRKDVQYGEPGPELMQMDLEDLASDLESFIDEVDAYVNG